MPEDYPVLLPREQLFVSGSKCRSCLEVGWIGRSEKDGIISGKKQAAGYTTLKNVSFKGKLAGCFSPQHDLLFRMLIVLVKKS